MGYLYCTQNGQNSGRSEFNRVKAVYKRINGKLEM